MESIKKEKAGNMQAENIIVNINFKNFCDQEQYQQ